MHYAIPKLFFFLSITELCLAVREYLQKCRTLSTKNDSGPPSAYPFLPFPLCGD